MYFLLNATEPVNSRLRDLFNTLLNGLGRGGFLFGVFESWQSAVGTVLDIVVTAFVIYFILKLFIDSRAWQLLKGVLFIIAFTFVCGVLGLNTINYILSNSISVLVVSFVVVFQPELRTALEAVGRNSLMLLSTVSQEIEGGRTRTSANFVEAIAMACEHMAATYTGALIVLERRTGLAELLQNSPTTVILNANLTATALEQIFFKNSPLHDGAVILKNGRIHAARCHVPLSDTYHLRRDMGTRHRAALGASEIGDTLAVVVSEEKGSISLAREGRIYELESADALRTNLYHILEGKPMLPYKREGDLARDGDHQASAASRPARHFGNGIKRFWESARHLHKGAKQGESPSLTDAADLRQNRRIRWQRRGMKVLAGFLSLFLYIYVQAMTNPIEVETFRNIPISKEGIDRLDQQGLKMIVNEQTVDVIIRSRHNTLSKLRNNPTGLLSSIHVPEEPLKAGRYSWRVGFTLEGISPSAYEIVSQSPLEIAVVLTREGADSEPILPGVNRPGSGGIKPVGTQGTNK